PRTGQARLGQATAGRAEGGRGGRKDHREPDGRLSETTRPLVPTRLGSARPLAGSGRSNDPIPRWGGHADRPRVPAPPIPPRTSPPVLHRGADPRPGLGRANPLP